MRSWRPQVLELLAEYRARGGLVCVVSHAEEDIIAAHYAADTSDSI